MLKITRKFYIVAVVAAVLLAVVASVIIVGARSKPNDLNNVTAIQLLVSKHYLLPENETPSLVTVTDRSKVTTDFLKQSQNNDKILVYEKAKRAIIYRPGIDRIIDVGPVDIVPSSTVNTR